MQLVVVGSGTAVPHPERVGSAHYLAAGEARLLMDCGPGAVHHLARFRLPWQRLTHLFISHFHNDHIGDVPALFFALKHGLERPRQEPFDVIGPQGTGRLFQLLADAFGDHVLEPGFEVRISESRSGDGIELDDSVRLTVIATPHTEASLACRIDAPAWSVGYTGDTGASHEIGNFMQGVDVLLAECSLPDESAMSGHLTPSSAADLAALARPGQLLLTHVYPPLESRDVAGLVREAGWDGAVRVVADGHRVSL